MKLTDRFKSREEQKKSSFVPLLVPGPDPVLVPVLVLVCA